MSFLVIETDMVLWSATTARPTSTCRPTKCGRFCTRIASRRALCAGLAAWHYYTAGFGLHNEIAHRAIHLTVVLGLCFLVFPRQKRLPGPWEWLVSLGLVAFYLVLGFSLLNALPGAVPAGAKAVFSGVLLGASRRQTLINCSNANTASATMLAATGNIARPSG